MFEHITAIVDQMIADFPPLAAEMYRRYVAGNGPFYLLTPSENETIIARAGEAYGTMLSAAVALGVPVRTTPTMPHKSDLATIETDDDGAPFLRLRSGQSRGMAAHAIAHCLTHLLLQLTQAGSCTAMGGPEEPNRLEIEAEMVAEAIDRHFGITPLASVTQMFFAGARMKHLTQARHRVIFFATYLIDAGTAAVAIPLGTPEPALVDALKNGTHPTSNNGTTPFRVAEFTATAVATSDGGDA